MQERTEPQYTVKSMSPETWPDFEALFARHRGVRGGCWCTFYLTTSSQYDAMSREQRRDFHRMLALRGEASGILVYDGAEPIAWCQFGPPALFPRYDRGRDYGALAAQGLEKPGWRIACLFTDKSRRKRGISKFTLHAALEEIARRGGGLAEAFPFNAPGLPHNQHTGSLDMYLREGFVKMAQLGKVTALVRKRI